MKPAPPVTNARMRRVVYCNRRHATMAHQRPGAVSYPVAGCRDPATIVSRFLLRTLRLLPDLCRRDEVRRAPDTGSAITISVSGAVRFRGSAPSCWCSRTSFPNWRELDLHESSPRGPRRILARRVSAIRHQVTAIPGSTAGPCTGVSLRGPRGADLPRRGVRPGHHAGSLRARLRLSPRLSRGDAHGAAGRRAHLHHPQVQAPAAERGPRRPSERRRSCT